MGDSEIEVVVGKSGVSGANDNRRKLIEICSEKRLIVENVFLRKMISIGLHGQVE